MGRMAFFGAAALTVALATAAPAHDSAGLHDHVLLAPGAYDDAQPGREYLGHFIHGRVHHGTAHHGDGHLNAGALYKTSAGVFYSGAGRSFAIFVSPNLVNEATARRTATEAALAHCRSVPGTTRVAFDKVTRHAPDLISAWLFQGSCR